MADFKDFLAKLSRKISLIHSLYGAEKVNLYCDSLKQKRKKTEYEMVHISVDGSEQEAGLFVFGSSFFISDLSEQEFKKKLSLNSLNLKIFRAYKELSEQQKKVKISEILTHLQDKEKDSAQVDCILRRILTLAYYFDWEITKDPKDLEGDKFIVIPDKFLYRLRQRFNFDNLSSIFENKDAFMFLNGRGTLNLVFKSKETFTREEIVSIVLPILRKVFHLKQIDLH
jgi:hypothetical protein